MRRVILKTSDIDSLRARLHQAAISPFLEIAPSGITLPALLELGCSCVMSPQSHAAHIERLVESWSKYLPEIGHVRQLFTTGARSRPQTAPFAAPLMELWPIQSRSDWTGEPASLFQSRFTRSLEKRGFGRKDAMNKPATEARSGINPFTKEPMEFAAKPASKTVKASPLKVAKDAV